MSKHHTALSANGSTMIVVTSALETKLKKNHNIIVYSIINDLWFYFFNFGGLWLYDDNKKKKKH